MSRYERILVPCDTIHRSPLNRASPAVGVSLVVNSVITAKSSVRLPGQGSWDYARPSTALAALPGAT